jgi:hypothetical protein
MKPLPVQLDDSTRAALAAQAAALGGAMLTPNTWAASALTTFAKLSPARAVQVLGAIMQETQAPNPPGRPRKQGKESPGNVCK